MENFLIGMVVGVAVGVVGYSFYLRHLINRTMRELNIDPAILNSVDSKELAQVAIKQIDNATAELTPLTVKVERVQDQIYMFRGDNDAFIGQSTDFDSLVTILTKKFPNYSIDLVSDDKSTLEHLNQLYQQSEKYNETRPSVRHTS